jgi:TrmH family RNA methyltransferase
MKTLSSRSNPIIKQTRALQRRKARAATGLYLVEGIHPVGEAFDAGAAVQHVCYAPDLLSSEFAHNLIQEQSKRGTPCYALTQELFTYLAGKENPQGLLAVVRQNQIELNQLSPDNFSWGVALVSPQDPGNIGTILRTVDAVGASGLLLLENSADPFHPTAVRASMGGIFWYPVVKSSFTEFTLWARKHEYQIFGTSTHGAIGYHDIKLYQRPLILLMGSEREGLSREQAVVCQEFIQLPMHGHGSSLNLAVATGIMLYSILDHLD